MDADEFVDTKFTCVTCGKTLLVSRPTMNHTENLQDAVGGFMVEHIDLHGGDPNKVYFQAPFEGTMMRCSQ